MIAGKDYGPRIGITEGDRSVMIDGPPFNERNPSGAELDSCGRADFLRCGSRVLGAFWPATP